MRLLAVPLLVGLVSCEAFVGPDLGEVGEPPDAERIRRRQFAELAESYIAWRYAQHPARATRDGVHDYDDMLEASSRGAIQGRIEGIRYYKQALWRLDRGGEIAREAGLLERALAAEEYRLEQLRWWERDPGYYNRIVSDGLYALSAYAFEPVERRLLHASRRLEEVPRVLEEAKENLRNPPRIYTEMALEGFAGTEAFLEKDLPRMFSAALLPALAAAATEGATGIAAEYRRFEDWTLFEQARRDAVRAIRSFSAWVRKDLLPRSKGDYALGPARFARLLSNDEWIDTPLDRLAAEARALLVRTQADFRAAAARLQPGREPREVLRDTLRRRPTAETLIERTRAALAAVQRWAGAVVEMPAEANVRVQETPRFRRSVSFASMEVPGPFETRAVEAYYSVTPVEPRWSPERKEQHLSFFNEFALPLISVHEAFPGHYLQALALRRAPTKLRKVLLSTAFTEGWAHYCEQLYAESHPENHGLRLHQVALALLRVCRLVVSIEIHARGMKLGQAAAFFSREGYLEAANAEREARRATIDPYVGLYTLGKEGILKAREEWRRRSGPSASVKNFHRLLLSQGAPPITFLSAAAFP